MYQILKKLLIVLLCLCLLSSFVFAADGPTPSVVVQWNRKFGSYNTSGSFNIDGASPSSSESGPGIVSFTSGSVSVDNSASSTTVFQLSPVSANFSASTSSNGFSVSSSVSDGVATISVVSSANRDSNLCGIDFSGSGVTIANTSFSASGYSYTSSGVPTPDPGDPGFPSSSMNGIQGWRYALSSAYTWETYNQYIGVRKIMYSYSFQGPDGGSNWNTSEIEGEEILYDMAVAISLNGYKWKIDPLTKDIVFYGYDGGMAKAGSWLDMIFRYLTYDYYWGTRLWSNDVSGSWFGSISDSFAYLNYRVNQILSVLANDEDLAIKDATTSERDWVKNYFNGSGDKADSDKYDKLNGTGSAFKDAFAGVPDSSIADGFTAVNDNGYEFWSQGVSDDINGNGASSSGASRAPAYVPPEQRIVDAYSENWAQIVGGYYD